MGNLNSIKKLEKFSGTNLFFLIIVGAIIYLIKIFKLIAPFAVNVAFLPLIDLIIITAGIIGAKYYFTMRSKIDKSISVENRIGLYSKHTLYILVIIDVIYAINLLIFLLTMSVIYIIIAGLLLVLYVVYRPKKESFSESLLSEEKKS